MTRRAGDAGSGGRAAGLGFRTTAAESNSAESAQRRRMSLQMLRSGVCEGAIKACTARPHRGRNRITGWKLQGGSWGRYKEDSFQSPVIYQCNGTFQEVVSSFVGVHIGAGFTHSTN